MTITAIIHTENKENLSVLFTKILEKYKFSNVNLLLHSRSYDPWQDQRIHDIIVSFKKYYAFRTELSATESVVDLITKCKTVNLVVFDENESNNFYQFNTLELLKSNLDTKYKTIKWFIMDIKTQLENNFKPLLDETQDCHRYKEKIKSPIFEQRIIHIDGGMGDHVLALPLINMLSNDIFISCRYPNVYRDSLDENKIINWDDELFGGYKRSVYSFGSFHNSTSIIDAFFCMYGERRKLSDKLLYSGDYTEIDALQTDKPIILICTSAAKINDIDSNKDWLDIRWFKLTNELKKKGFCVIQVGSSKDNQIPNVDTRLLDRKFSDIAFAIKKCRLWISVDTFFHHFAASINPEVGICLTPFYNDHAKHIGVTYIEEDCGTDFSARKWWLDSQQPERKDCMYLITVDKVIQTIENKLSNNEMNFKFGEENIIELKNKYVSYPTFYIDNDENLYSDNIDDANFTLFEDYYQRITEKKLSSVMLVGRTDTRFINKLSESDIETLIIEPFESNTKETENSSSRFVRQDYRKPIKLENKFDAIFCNDIFSQVDIPFIGTIIGSLIDHSDLIWVSTSALLVDNKSEFEKLNLLWSSVFDFFGYGKIVISEHGNGNIQLCLFYNKKSTNIEKYHSLIGVSL